MIGVFKLKHILLAFSIVVVIVASIFFASFSSRTEYVFIVPNSTYTVVVDAGHGGIDGGCVGTSTGVYESDLNLEFAFNLASQLKNLGISVVLTRADANGLYDTTASNLKRSDMKKRKEIIETVAPDVVVSIHMNAYPLRSCCGAQTFFKKGNDLGQSLSQMVQTQLFKTVQNAKSTTKTGDYYILNCTDIPSVLVECGFLSNASEELLLQQTDYQTTLCYAVMCGVIEFLNANEA
jgi:N-acetylmuramoyl-L-alanine amidase